MFDQPATNQAPGNLPADKSSSAKETLIKAEGQVEDIFVNSEKSKQTDPHAGFKFKSAAGAPAGQPAAGIAGKGPEHFLSGGETSQAERAGQISKPAVSAEAQMDLDFDKEDKPDKKRYFLIGLFGLIIIGAGAAAYLFLAGPEGTSPVDYQAEVNPTESQDNSRVLEPPPPSDSPSVPETQFPGAAPADGSGLEETAPPVPEPPADTDQDGLSDNEERALGTNSLKADTDGDGLFDLEEVKVFVTDPLDPDTDGDGFMDGEEVANGYDPRGAGQLLPDISQ